MCLEVGLEMKGENKEINIGRSEEFSLAGHENTTPFCLKHSPETPVLLSPPFFTCLSVTQTASAEDYLASGT